MPVQPGYPAPGEMIGPYRIERTLGGGGMGVVFAALDVGLNRPVAIKVIAPHLADDPEFRTRFTREAQALAALDSAHVVHVYAYGEVDGRLYIATQLIPDGDLAARLQKYGAPPLPVALDLVAQVASGLADAHAAGLIHRDIKPANVLLRHRHDSHQAYLSDFGIARKAGSETMTGSGVAGTPSYMAPELHTAGTAGVESDVYSLGCLLWAAVTGTAPYRGTSDYQIATSHFVEPIPQLAGDEAAIAETNRILRTAMAKQPGDRYASAAALRDDLRRAQSLAPGHRIRGCRPVQRRRPQRPGDSGDPRAPSPPTRRPGRRPGRGGRRRRHRGCFRAEGSQRRSRDRSGPGPHHQPEREYDADESRFLDHSRRRRPCQGGRQPLPGTPDHGRPDRGPGRTARPSSGSRRPGSRP